MKMLKIKADNMHDALSEARKLLGEDAVILQTKQLEEPAVFGLCKKQAVEIIAAGEPVAIRQAVPAMSVKEPDKLVAIEQRMEELQRALAELASGMVVARRREFPQSVERLIRNGVSETLAESVLSGCNESRESVLNAISRRLRCTGPIDCSGRQQRVALVGPTGVGKTTTAAKLAAQYSIFHKKKVALLTLDTYRIGAVEQLAAYARILNIPLEVALSQEDSESLIRKHEDKDLIIIDTVGRSQRNREHIAELAAFLRQCKPTEVHLTLSASADLSARKEAIDSFSSLHADRVLLTKLDECSQPGCALELAAAGMMPYSYVTTGQDVPEDIAAADSESLAKFVWEGSL